MEIKSDSSDPTSSAGIEILGGQYRASAPRTQIKALERAMREVQAQTNALADSGRANERIAVQAAITIAFNALVTERGVQGGLDKLIHQLDTMLEERGFTGEDDESLEHEMNAS